jgi:hypothetical protein
MSLLKFFLKAATSAATEASLAQAWKDDPLRHPDLARMSVTELADLPLSICRGEPAAQTLAKCA